MNKKYCKKFGKYLIKIDVSWINNNDFDFFDFIFKKWHDRDDFELNKYTIHISDNYLESDIKINSNHQNWKFDFLNNLESNICKLIADVAIHGSAIIFNNKMLWLVGKRWSGKSTLAHNIIERFPSFFIEDDCIMLIDNKVYGLGFPSKSRTIIKKKEFIEIDEFGAKRYLYFNEKIINEIDLYPIIIFVHYNENYDNVHKINQKDLFEQLLCNCKYSNNNKSKFYSLMNICKCTNAYKIEYTCFDNFLKFFYENIKEDL